MAGDLIVKSLNNYTRAGALRSVQMTFGNDPCLVTATVHLMSYYKQLNQRRLGRQGVVYYMREPSIRSLSKTSKLTKDDRSKASTNHGYQ